MRKSSAHFGIIVVASFACGNAGPGSGRGTQQGSTQTTAGTGAGGGPIVPGGAGGSIIITGDGGVVVSGDAACVAETREGEHAPVDLYVMQDKSGSMNCPTGMGAGSSLPSQCGASQGAMGPSRWASLTSALTTFVNAPGNAGIGIGIGFFPVLPAGMMGADPNCLINCNGDCACTMACGCKMTMPIVGGYCVCADPSNQSCTGSDYAVPAVEIARLPGVASAVTMAINGTMPNGSTPTAPALDGALQHAKTWATAHPHRRTAVIYSTDGQPDGCDANNTIATAANLAKAAFAGTPSISTYVIGVGSSDLVAGLNQIAAAGGTTKAYQADTGGNVAQQLADALGSIRSSTLTCDYTIPSSTSGKLDFAKVNVQVQVGSGSPMAISQVPNKAACGTGPGWYYDNPAQPTLITLCPATCDPLLMTPGSRLDVLIGCKTDVRVN